MERRREKVGQKRRDIPLKKYIDHCYVNFDEYIARKGNPSVMVCGRSGMGKSELMNVLLLSGEGAQDSLLVQAERCLPSHAVPGDRRLQAHT